MSEGPNEHTTLIAKEPRRRSDKESDAISYNDEGSANEDSTAASLANGSYISYGSQLGSVSSLHSDNFSSFNGEQFDTLCYDCGRWKFYLVEPMIMVLLFAYNLSSTVLKNQIIYQTCAAIYMYNNTDCQSLGTKNASEHTKEIQTEIQPYVAQIFLTMSLIESILPALCGVYIGAWSDRYGRKPLLITAFIGYTLYYMITTVISYMSIEVPMSPWYYLLAVLPHALLGGSITYTVATYCFISDVSTMSERPYRMAFYEAAMYIGLMIGSFCAGYIYEATNSTVIFATSTLSLVFATLIIVLFVPESLYYRRDEWDHVEGEAPNAPSNAFFNFEYVRDLWRTCFMPRQFNDRAIIWLAILAILVAVFVVDGSGTVFYLFIQRQFAWTVKQYTTYETVSILMSVGGNLLGLWLLRKILKISIVNLAILAFASQVGSSFMKAFAVTGIQLYIAVAVGAFRSLANPMCRTLITNIVPSHSLGKIFAFKSFLQSLMPFLAGPIYTGVYSITLISFPGFFNLLSANLYILAIVFLLIILRKRAAHPEQYEPLFN